MPRTVIDRLRATTGAAHRALDEGLNVIERLATPGRRTAMLLGYYRLHVTTEPAILVALADTPALDVATRCRAGAIAASLRDRGVTPPTPPAPPIGTRAEALGALYVMEGSTLGGRTILRDLRQRGVETAELAFLDPYGARGGAMWRSLVDILETDLATDDAALDAACRAASATFRLAAECLADTVALSA